MTHGEAYEERKRKTAFLRKVNWAWGTVIGSMWLFYFLGIYHPETVVLYAMMFILVMYGFNTSLAWNITKQEARLDEQWKHPETRAKYNEEISDDEDSI